MSRSPSPIKGQTDLSGAKVMKPNNGWTREQEELMAGWSDIAACYRWMHDRCEKIMAKNNMMITVPVIVLSTLTGSANFIMSSVTGDDPIAGKWAQIGIGGVSIFTGILTTLGNFFRYAQSSESHRVASIAWGKFQRQLAVELALHPRERIECMDFLKICRAELDRLIEQSPPIPDKVIQQFESEFKHIPELKKPDIAHGMDHTRVFIDKDTRLKNIAVDAALMLKAKSKILKNSLIPDMEIHMDRKLKHVVADLSGNHLSRLQDKVAELERIVADQNERLASQHAHRFPVGHPGMKTFLRDPQGFVVPRHPLSKEERRLSIQLPSNTASRSTSPERVSHIHLTPHIPPPPTPLTQKTIDHTLPGSTSPSSDDLISALIVPRNIANDNVHVSIDDK